LNNDAKEKDAKDKEKSGSAKTTGEEKKKEENQLAKTVKDSTKIAAEAQHGLIAQVLKDVIFSLRPGMPETSADRVGEAVEMSVG
jgi:COP9 signalosome complex subunit 5